MRNRGFYAPNSDGTGTLVVIDNAENQRRSLTEMLPMVAHELTHAAHVMAAGQRRKSSGVQRVTVSPEVLTEEYGLKGGR